jgi:hypothetical protein
LLSTTCGGSDRVFDACWKNDNEFMAVDAREVHFYTLNGKNLMAKKGIIDQGLKDREIGSHLCCTYAFNGSVCLTGTKEGKMI